MNKKSIALNTLQAGLSIGLPLLLLNSAGIPMDFGITKETAEVATNQTSNLAVGGGLIAAGLLSLRYTKKSLNTKIAGIESETVKVAAKQTKNSIMLSMFMVGLYFLSGILLGFAENVVSALTVITTNWAYGLGIIGAEVAAGGVAVYKAYDKDMNKEIKI